MDAWTFVWLMLLLKIPLVALFLIVRWAVRPVPEPAAGEDGGIGPRTRPKHPHHPRTRRPRPSRRGPHGEQPAPSPPRVRKAVSRTRLPQR